MMAITATKLRENVYSLLDEALRTGEPIEVERKGQIVRIVPPAKKSKLDNLSRRPCIVGDPNEIVSIDWSSEWSELK